jgi:hypothetical protein
MDLLAGAVDAHVHACPHINARRLDVLEAVREAAVAGYAGIGFIDNFANASGYAALAARALPELGLDVFGGLVMEPPAGGVSPAAVRAALGYGYGPGQGARFVSFPTHATRHVARLEGRSPAHVESCFHVPERGPLPSAVAAIVELVAEADAVLNLGHLSAPEAIRLAEFARERGAERILAPANTFSPGEVVALCAAGAHVEFSFFFASHATQVGLTHVDAEKHAIPFVPAPEMAERIRAADPARVVLSSDCGSALLPPPVEGLRQFLLLLEACGIEREPLRRAVTETPARLFRVRAP